LKLKYGALPLIFAFNFSLAPYTKMSRLTEAHGIEHEAAAAEVSRLTEANALASESRAVADAALEDDTGRMSALLTVGP
jgi:hypothetical protein